MTDVLGESPEKYYSSEEAKRYNLSGAFKRIQTRMTMDALSIGDFVKKSKVLDIGCGTGFSTIEIQNQGFKVVGIDISKDMLVHAKEKGLTVYLADMKSLPFKDEEFDYAVSISTIQWAKPTDYEIVLSEICRVIKSEAVVQFYPKNSVEFDYFIKKAKKLFFVEVYEIGESNKRKTYIRLKKR